MMMRRINKTHLLWLCATLLQLPTPTIQSTIKEPEYSRTLSKDKTLQIEQREIDDAVDHGVRLLEELVKVKEPLLYKLGYTLKSDNPASKVANFGAPTSRRAILHSRIGYAMVEASKRIATSFFKDAPRASLSGLQSRASLDGECPFQGKPKCPAASRRFRTSDGTCNNLKNPWRGAALLPMQRFLPPVYEDGVQSIRLSVQGTPLPSPRAISTTIHRDQDHELLSVTSMFMQWGQFLDHDLTSTVKSRSFNGSIPRCCEEDGSGVLPEQFLHPLCLPITVPPSDPFLSQFGVGCMEFTRSAPSTRFDCELGWREQMNQATSYIDASMIYGSNRDTLESLRTFSGGGIFYGIDPPDPPEGEVCTSGAVSEECLQPGDGRVSENPGLIALHTVFVRYHNKIAGVLSTINPHWSDERVFQETRRIVYSAVQHITFKEYLPLVLGPEVMDSFELRLLKRGYYGNYNDKVNPTVANSFSTAAFRFGHSMVQNSFIRTDSHHRPLVNNVSLHDEILNVENIWSAGSLDRLLLGLSNQPSQRRDEFIADELTNHLFQFGRNVPFGMDLAAINIQRGRDHGIPPYTFWRKPCGLSEVNSWRDLEGVTGISAALRMRSLYAHVDDIDLFTGGLAEKPLKGAVSGPTFACIIAQQFANLRAGDRFWYENDGFESSFSPAQLQQIRKVTLAQILCQTLNEIETVQPFVLLTADRVKNVRVTCETLRNFDLGPWVETVDDDFIETNELRVKRGVKTRLDVTKRVKPNNVTEQRYNRPTKYSTAKPIKATSTYYHIKDSTKPEDVTYLLGIVPPQPLQVNINIHYSTPAPVWSPAPIRRKQTTASPNLANDVVVITSRPSTYSPFDSMEYSYASQNGYKRPNTQYRPTKQPQYAPTSSYSPPLFEEAPFASSNVPSRPDFLHYYNRPTTNSQRPLASHTIYRQDELTDDILDSFFTNRKSGGGGGVGAPGGISDKLDFKTRVLEGEFVKVASVRKQEVFAREGDDVIEAGKTKKIRVMDVDVMPSEPSGQWRTVHAKEEEEEREMEVPALPMSIPCSHEVPRPLIRYYSPPIGDNL
ncbi:chorion peroxidase-like isoform X2 [Anthonomus grandis grandis]|uniref:chorion peroxidase-like isoform X2 n=1 Tax=Anthonomus grandis grandis TaxID=2921223 RepID=UPI0021661C3A|nr:chorion peroxidase-like isoform X2 [Anthonomus grandis grandis]